MNASTIGGWLDCSWRMMYEDKCTVSQPVSAVVGQHVHQLMSEEDINVDEQKLIKFDKNTPSELDIKQQAIEIVRDFNKHIDNKGWEIISKEAPMEAVLPIDNGENVLIKCRIDAVVLIDNEIFILEYKTSDRLTDIALQLATNMMIFNANNANFDCAGGVCLWRPRKGKKNEVNEIFFTKDKLVRSYPSISFVANLVVNINPIPNPKSMSCYYCTAECPVRPPITKIE